MKKMYFAVCLYFVAACGAQAPQSGQQEEVSAQAQAVSTTTPAMGCTLTSLTASGKMTLTMTSPLVPSLNLSTVRIASAPVSGVSGIITPATATVLGSASLQVSSARFQQLADFATIHTGHGLVVQLSYTTTGTTLVANDISLGTGTTSP